MKILTKMLLIHWHYFTHELVEFGTLNFLTGKNASGKSTIIDALQVILLGDTSGSFFNKAASGRGSRTLRGYLLGELGDDEIGGFHYLRNDRFTSYIALEFYDDEKDRNFTAGCCFDIYSKNDISKLFFLYDGKMHEQGFLKEQTPMDIQALRSFLKEKYAGHYETTDVARDFRINLYGRLGGLQGRFAGLFKKAVSFNPDVDIQRFISDFVCDTQQTVDVSHMQDNIRSYKRLEAEASILQDRISALEKIVETHERFTDARSGEILYSYLIDRASAEMKATQLTQANKAAQEVSDSLSVLNAEIEDSKKRLIELREQRDTLHAELLSNGASQALAEIDRQIFEKEQHIKSLKDEYEKEYNHLLARIATWRSGADTLINKIGAVKTTCLNVSITSRIEDISAEGKNLLGSIASLVLTDANAIDQLGVTGLSEISDQNGELKTHAIELASRLHEEKGSLESQYKTRLSEQDSLRKGIYRFPQDALDLQEALSSRLKIIAKQPVHVRIVAQVTEIKNDRWRNAIEGYLHTQKYYIIVPPAYFKDALHVFNTIKRQRPVYGTGIIDVDKLRRIQPNADIGSLAEELETEDMEVRLFLDYTLGRVRKCDNVQDLRRYRTAITDEGVLYQNFVVRAIHPKRFEKPAIGQGAIQRRLDAVKQELENIAEQVSVCTSVNVGLTAINSTAVWSDSEIERIISSAKNSLAMPKLASDLSSLKKSRGAIDASLADSLKNRIADLDGDIAAQDDLQRNKGMTYGKLNEKERRLIEETIPHYTKELKDLEDTIVSRYEPVWVSQTGEPRYTKELLVRGIADAIANAFPREQSRARNAKEDAWDSLVNLRRSYNDKYKMGLNIHAVDNDVYDEAWIELTDNKLPDYQTKINDAKSKAFEHFQEDFISRLQYNINSTKSQIDELNTALKGASFGEDTYRFHIKPKQENKRFYEMIVDEMITQGGYNLLSSQFNDKYRNEIADLFKIITNEEGVGGTDSSEYERRVREFTDFRSYLSFDLEVMGQDGQVQRLSRTLGKKSGGETQTPFYIAVLASFAQLYRSGRDKTYKTARLIIFDEAFSKMDGERIVRSIELLRKFQFQVILSAPPDKIGDIATLVDRNLCVLREGKHACVRSFDPRQVEDL